MFHRIIYEDWQLIFPFTALAVASLVFLAAGRAAHLKSGQPARVPFDDE